MEIMPSSKYVISSDSITINKELGAGEFGVVQQGVWTNEEGERIQVAIKCLSKQRMQNNSMEFLKEAAMMHSIEDEHIVRLFGVVLDSSSLMLVTELAPLRSLLECLKEPALRPSFPIISLCDFSQQIADGMLYLENKRLIHRDLAARNILVFARNRIKISDFGLSRALGVGKDYYQTNFNVNLKLPIAWCAPECINYLKFTSASDVWAYGVTLWEMFSYGFQPWAALTGQQILEAIDEPNLQRLEQPDSCPKEYYSLMLKCWEHQPALRPKFTDIVRLLPDCRPELVQVVKECRDFPAAADLTAASLQKKDYLVYKIGDVITVLDKKPNLPASSSSTSNGSSSHNRMSQHLHQDHNSRQEEISVNNGHNSSISSDLWKGSLLSGKTGLFDPGNTVTYLGHTLPQSAGCPLTSSLSTTPNGGSGSGCGVVGGGVVSGSGSSHHHANHVPGLTTSNFIRGILEAISSSASGIYSSKRKLKRDMISMPQSDFKHTGHVGVDGAFFGDISFLGDKYQQLPSASTTTAARNGSLTRTSSDLSDRAPLLKPLLATATSSASASATASANNNASGSRAYEKFAATNQCMNLNLKDLKNDHEYHEITGEDQDDCFLESPHFETLDFGPSLMDEVFRELDIKSDETEHHNSLNECSSNVKNEIRESMVSLKRKTKSCVKPISATDEQTLDSAIAMAKEMASRSIMELDGRNDNMAFECPSSADSPKTPNSPNKKTSKFSFKFKSSPKCERRTFSEEAENIPDISCDPALISEAARAAYDMLIEKKGDGMKRKMTAVLPPQAPANFTSSRQHLQQHNYQDQQQQPPVHSSQPQHNTTISNGNGHSEQHCEDDADSNPLRMLRSGVAAFSKVRGNKQRLSGSSSLRIPPASSSRSSLGAPPPIPVTQPTQPVPTVTEETSSCLNPLPLPPKSATCTMKVTLKHHQRLHPLKMVPLDQGSSDSLSDESQPYPSPPSLSSFRPHWPSSKQASCPDPPVRNMSSLTISAPVTAPVPNSNGFTHLSQTNSPNPNANPTPAPAGITRSDSSGSSHTPRPTALPPPPPGPPKPSRLLP